MFAFLRYARTWHRCRSISHRAGKEMRPEISEQGGGQFSSPSALFSFMFLLYRFSLFETSRQFTPFLQVTFTNTQSLL